MDLAGPPDAAARDIIAALGLEPLVPEGGWFRRRHTGAHLTAIHYLVPADDFSAMHRLRGSDELYFFHAGAPLRMLLLDGPQPQPVLLGPDPRAGHRPSLVIPAGIWQGASTTGAWSFVSAVVTPGFSWDDFELGHAEALSEAFPAAAELIAALSRG